MLQYDSLTRRLLTVAGLSGLAAYGKPIDIKIGRKYIKDPENNVRYEAFHIIERFGDASDINLLLDLIKNETGSIKVKAARLALKFATDLEDISNTLLKISDNEIKEVVIEKLASDETILSKQILESLLNEKNDSIRRKAVIAYAKKLSVEEIESFLAEYQSKGDYLLDTR